MIFKRDYCPMCHSKMHWVSVTLFGYHHYRGTCGRCGYMKEHHTSARNETVTITSTEVTRFNG